MIFPLYSEYSIELIRNKAQSAILVKDEECKYKIGSILHLWYKMPNEPGAYEFAHVQVMEIKDIIWEPVHDTIILIDSQGKWKHFKGYGQQEPFTTACGYSSPGDFKNKKKDRYESRVLCLAPTFGKDGKFEIIKK